VGEKSMFFAALERLGKDDVPGIASAVRTKSIPEVRQLLLLLEDAAKNEGKTKVTLCDIPAAAEIGAECSARLDFAADALGWYQERFEAKREQERFGEYWLITPKIAQEIEDVQSPSRRPSFTFSPPPGLVTAQDAPTLQKEDQIPQILQDIPEANLLIPSTMLQLSTELFMNGSPNPPSPYPHWSTLVSPLASKPSIYRTALIDFHTLVLSLTKRLVQASIIQASSRIRSQGWRIKKGVNPLVKKRDVYTAMDMLRMPRDARERWRRVARRCGLRVIEGRWEKNQREVPWKEVEEIPGSRNSQEPTTTDDEATPGTDHNDFKARAAREGTPLPSPGVSHTVSDDDEESDGQYLSGDSGAGSPHINGTSSSASESAESPLDADEIELQYLESFDQHASREEELRLFDVLGTPPPFIATSTAKAEDGLEQLNLAGGRTRKRDDDWRDWTEYRAEWEEFDEPVPMAAFEGNRKSPSPAPLPSIEHSSAEGLADSGLSSDTEGLRGRRRSKRRKVVETEIPIRGARAYAALRERLSGSEDRNSDAGSSADVDAKVVPSIESTSMEESRQAWPSADEMDWDAKPVFGT
jgi:hypothetical protein